MRPIAQHMADTCNAVPEHGLIVEGSYAVPGFLLGHSAAEPTVLKHGI